MKHNLRWKNTCQTTKPTGSTTTHKSAIDSTHASVSCKDYLDSKSNDFDGIETKRFLLGQAREQVTWYRQSIDAIDYVGAVACRRSLENGQPFLEHYLPAYNFRETERGTEYKRDTDFPILPPMWSRPDPDADERFPDASETPDDGLPDLR